MSVFDTINSIYKEVGASSNTRRQGLIEALLIAATPLEGQYIIRILSKSLRIGIQNQTILIATGFNDDDLATLSTAIEKNVVSEMPGNYRANIVPDVWVTPELIFEVRAADISASPTYNAAETLRDKG
uniref:DNA ligase 1-like n=1 Tax=Dermatophagoides pteronyssinus TaxID=6956 RepID=A0A6P6Y7U4_DERPT|nr:DNA ligase 1-like [Dermatophagoides pteronyssinus]